MRVYGSSCLGDDTATIRATAGLIIIGDARSLRVGDGRGVGGEAEEGEGIHCNRDCRRGRDCRGSVRKALELEKKVEGDWWLSGHTGSDLYMRRGFRILGSDNGVEGRGPAVRTCRQC